MTTLGICIPTYKRPDFLLRCVTSAINAAGECPVRIFISDDSLGDTNIKIYDQLEQYADRISIYRNTVNLGIDDNIQQCINMCDCDYAWIIGEDDYFLPNSIARVYEGMQKSNSPFFFANYSYVGDDESRILGCAVPFATSHMTSYEFMEKYLWAAGFIGACIINRRRWSSTVAAPYKNTYYTHLGRICELLANCDERVFVFSDPCVANRVEGSDTFTWSRDSYGVFFGFCRMCQTVGQRYPHLSDALDQAIGVMERRYGWLSLRLAIRLRSELGYDNTQYRLYLKPNISNRLKRLAFYLISIAPPKLLSPIIVMYRAVCR